MNLHRTKGLRICLITGTWGRGNLSAFSNSVKLIDLLQPFAYDFCWIVTNGSIIKAAKVHSVNIHPISFNGSIEENIIIRLIRHSVHQCKIIIQIFKNKKFDLYVFAEGARSLFLPFIFVSFFFRGKAILRLDGRTSIRLSDLGESKLKVFIVECFERLMFLSAFKIAFTFNYVFEHCKLNSYKHKSCYLPLYVDTSLFRDFNPLKNRKYDVGYIGRISDGKGILELVEAISLILEKDKSLDIRAIIVGSGPLERKVRSIVSNLNLSNHIDLLAWIDNSEIYKYLNEIKILVLPSKREGLPNIILEAGASGCIILATPVGGIPDIIIDGDTGFITKNNNPDIIAENISRILKFENLNIISLNMKRLIKNNYSYKYVIELYRNEIEKVGLNSI